MLKYEQIIPADVRDDAPLLVLMHGRGADRFNLLPLGPELSSEAIVIAPEAPWSGVPWGYGPGWAWYRFMGGNRPEPESFERSQNELALLLSELPSRLPVAHGPVILAGFSQGGVMAMAYALRNPRSVPLVMNLSGFLADHPSVDPTPATVSGTRFFWGHGTGDPQIPFELAIDGRQRLHTAGADLTARDYPIGHAISAEEFADARAWLADGVAAAAAG